MAKAFRGRSDRRGIIADIDVILVSYNSARDLESSLTSARKIAGGRVVVVDNASGDDSASVARRHGADVVVANAQNLGFARAVNLGLASCDSEHVLLLNPDAQLDETAAASMLEAMRGRPDAAIVAPLLRDPSGVVRSGAGHFATLTRRVGMCLPLVGRTPYFAPQYRLDPDLLRRRRFLAVDYVFGAAMLVERSFLGAVGGLDERFFLFAEDEDLCRQAKAAGRRVLLDTRAVARHTGGASYVGEAPIEAQRLYSTYLLFDKWRGPAAARAYSAGILAAFRLRVLAARAERRSAEAATIGRTAALFGDAVRGGGDPLQMPAGAPSPPRPVGSRS